MLQENQSLNQFQIYVFSGTGNTLRLAALLQEALSLLRVNTSLKSFETGLESVVTSDLIICYPVHAFNAPANVVRFCKNLPAGTGRVYFFKTSGEPLRLNDNSSTPLIRIVRRKGYRYMGEFHYIMPYNMLFRHTDELAARMLLAAQEHIPNAASLIAEGKTHIRRRIPLRARLISFLCKIETPGVRFNGRLFRVRTDKCVRCMECVRNCPVQNIRYRSGKFRFGGKCICCARCFFHCPADAYRIGLLDSMRVNGEYDFTADASLAVAGGWCGHAYKKYFAKEPDAV